MKLLQNYLWYCFEKLLEFEYGSINCSASAVSKLTLHSTSCHHRAVNASTLSALCYIWLCSSLNGLLTSKFHKKRNPCLCQWELVDLRVLDKVRTFEVGWSSALQMGNSRALNQLSKSAEGNRYKVEDWGRGLALVPSPPSPTTVSQPVVHGRLVISYTRR